VRIGGKEAAIPARAVLLGLVAAFVVAAARGQENPVYTDDSPLARDTLASVGPLVASGNHAEAVRLLQRLLDEQGDRLLESPDDPDLFSSVRAAVHRRLLSDPELLEWYRTAQGPAGARDLAAGRVESVEHDRLLTRAGYEAALRLAQMQTESARFHAALRTLMELDGHPDRHGESAIPAARLAATLARYVPGSTAPALARRWAAQSRLPEPDLSPIPAPIGRGSPVVGPLDPMPEADDPSLSAIGRRPLWSVLIDAAPVAGRPRERSEDSPEQSLLSGESIASEREELRILPAVGSDRIYINDGASISAWDRFTLQPIWRTRPSPDGYPDLYQSQIERRNKYRRGTASLIEDSSSVTVSGRVVVATTGLAWRERREGDPRVHALDADTGRVLWSVDPAHLDERLARSHVRGPAIVDGPTVIVSMLKFVRARRLASVFMVGLDLDDGSLRWVRLLGTSGSLPYAQRTWVGDTSVLGRGVVFRADRLGVVAAIEAATGRPLWVRRVSAPATDRTVGASPWETQRPVLAGESVIVLSTDGQQILRLGRESGRIIERRSGLGMGRISYLLLAGRTLVGVGVDRIGLLSATDLAESSLRVVNLSPEAGAIRGRVVVMGTRLLIPVDAGMVVVDTSHPGEGSDLVRVENSGNAVLRDGQLIVMDDRRLFSYLPWERADALLSERVRASSRDAGVAITLAELAYRAGRAERIIWAVDRALSAMAAPGAGGQDDRRRLFRSLLAMIDANHAVRLDAQGAAPLTLFDDAQLDGLVERLDRVALSARERVSYLMELGRLNELRGRDADAIDAYQRILLDEALASAAWTSPRATVRAEIEASRRMRALMLSRGAGVYARYEVSARSETQSLAPDARAEAIERLARRYPLSSTAVELWRRAALVYKGDGRTRDEIVALSNGLRAADTAVQTGQSIDPALHGDLAGRLILTLREMDRIVAAAQVLRRVRSAHPDLVLLDNGRSLDAAALEEDLSARLSSMARLPRIGPHVGSIVQALQGWRLMPSRARQLAPPVAEHAMLISGGESRFGLWGIWNGQEASGDSLVRMLWSRAYEHDQPPTLVRLDAESALMYWPGQSGGHMERIDAIDGHTLWTTPEFRDLFEPDAAFERRQAERRRLGGWIETPTEGRVRLDDQLVTMDAGTIVLAERTGRVAAFDSQTGALLWARQTGIDQVYDVHLGSGLLAVAGARDGEGPDGDLVGQRPGVRAYDARTGTLAHDTGTLSEAPAWVRVAGVGNVIIGLESSVVSIDPLTGKTNWEMFDQPTVGSLGAWIFGDRLFLLSQEPELWLGSVSSGQLGEHPLEDQGKLAASATIRAHALGLNVALSTDRGVLIYDTSGRLVGSDALGFTRRVLPPAPAEAYFVSLERSPVASKDGRPAFWLHVLTRGSAMEISRRALVMFSEPDSLALLDGRVLISAGGVTQVYSLAQEDAPRP